VGSLVLDVVIPSPGAVVALPTVLGTVLTLAAIIVATLPWPKGSFARRGPAKGR
jgi:transporter family-2 protein